MPNNEQMNEAMAEAIYCMKPHQLTPGQMDTVRRAIAAIAALETQPKE